MKTKLFDLKYVYECWNDELKTHDYWDMRSFKRHVNAQAANISLSSLMQSIEKLAYMGVDITAPAEIINQIPSIEVLENKDSDFEFITPEGHLIKYVYYDPNLAVKIAHMNGADIEFYNYEDEAWHTASQLLWDEDILQWDDGTLYRIKGEDKKPKLQWDSLTIGDVITNGTGLFEMVTCININDVNSHIYVMDRWISDEELKEFRKVED